MVTLRADIIKGYRMSDPVSIAAIVAMAASATASGYSAYQGHVDAKEAQARQDQAQAEAKIEQQKADREAEQQRLEGIASNQTATTYGNIWGVDNAYANRYKDAAQKLSAGTGSFDTDDDDNNPFYTRGLL